MAAADGSDSGDVIYGLHAVREALAARARQFQRILIVGGRDDRRLLEIQRLARAAHVPVHIQPRPVLDRLVSDGRHQGIVGLIASKTYVHPDDMLAHARERNERAFIVLLDEVQDPQNLGAVLRTAEAAGVHGVILPERRSAGLTPTVAKASAGAMDHMRVARVTNLSRTIEWLQEAQVWTYALDPRADLAYTSLDFRGPVALVLGGEGKGLRAGVRDICDERAKIPMQGRVGSLNVSAAAAVVLFEVVRQRYGDAGGTS
jgi:23S rRNA (guanosine2251-2'-O)-methyltransferase